MRGFAIEHRADFDDFTRVTLLRLFGFRVVLHIFKKSDHLPFHDHPYNILSILLWGKYTELTPVKDDALSRMRARDRRAPSIWWIPATRAHKILLFPGQRTITLCVLGRKFREWGFLVGGQWVHNKTHLLKKGLLR